MPIIVIFFLGIANFALHKATLESRHPLAVQMQAALERFAGRHGSLLIEFLLLLGALAFAANGIGFALVAYAVYTLLNGLAVWALLTGRV